MTGEAQLYFHFTAQLLYLVQKILLPYSLSIVVIDGQSHIYTDIFKWTRVLSLSAGFVDEATFTSCEAPLKLPNIVPIGSAKPPIASL